MGAGGLWIVLILYFLPSLVAGMREHRNGNAIFLLNLLLGWTVLGWIIALIWSATGVRIPQTPPAPIVEYVRVTEPLPPPSPRAKTQDLSRFN